MVNVLLCQGRLWRFESAFSRLYYLLYSHHLYPLSFEVRVKSTHFFFITHHFSLFRKRENKLSLVKNRERNSKQAAYR